MSSTTTTQPIKTDPITADPLTTDSIRTELITAEPVKGYEFENKKAMTKLHENTWMSLIEQCITILSEKNIYPTDEFKNLFQNEEFITKVFQLFDQDMDGVIKQDDWMKKIRLLVSNTYDFNLNIFKHLKKLYLDHTSNPRGMTLKEFMTLVNIRTDTFGKRIFALFDKDGSDFMTWPEFMDSMQCYSGKQQDKLRFLFNMYDSDGNGLISQEELAAFLKDSMAENGITLDEHITHGLASALFADANPNKQTGITFEALKNQIEKHDGLLENLTICSDKLLVTPGSDESKSFFDKFKLPRKLQSSYIKNNYIKITFLAMYVLTNLIIFVSRAYQYKGNNGYFILAKACGRCLSFNIPFSFILMLRQCITFLRNRGFNNYLPLDHHIYLHKLTGINITILSIVHTVMHFGNLIYKMDTDGFSVPFRELTTGVLLLLILIILFIFSLPFIRQKASFEIFYRTHLLCMLFIAVGTIGHVTVFYYWISGPLALFIIEFFYRHASQVSEKGKTYSTEGVLLPSRVTHLRIKKPRNFDFRPGDYVFVNIPVIAYWEWHPFTISSAPEEKDYFSLHIRGVGGWTNNLYSYLEQEYIHNPEYRNRPVDKYRAVVRAQTENHFKQLKGVNFSSFEQSFRYKRNVPDVITFPIPKTDDEIEDKTADVLIQNNTLDTMCNSHMRSSNILFNLYVVLKVDFFWLNRSQHSFEWFVDLLTQLEIDQAENESKHRDEDGKTTVERFLEMHMYVTSAPAKTDMKAVALNMGLDLLFQKEKLDFITGLKTRSKTGRPDWDEVFQELKNKQKGKITVFYCGPPQLGRILRKRCEKVGFGFRKESF
ncbi:unnamed protein product [Trichogramma brassicae]|uniref:NADPH oxidase 5 n=1 Tax=Trichogramma brassicae TaxID=86971 RepID=A0A6H5I254_9HYME|nr:unnamed protein product [Trichogramma brassicae]